MTDLTKEQIEAMLDGTTEGPWSIPSQPDKVCVEGYTKNGWGKVILSASSPSWMRLDEPACNARLASAAPDLARTALSLYQRVEDAEAAQALTVERAGEYVAQNSLSWRFSSPWHGKDFQKELLGLADPSSVKALAALRAERDAARSEMDRLQTKAMAAVDAARTAEAERDTLAASLAAAQAEVKALREAATLAMSDMEVAFKPGTSVVELIRLGTGAAIRPRTVLAAHDSRNDKEGG